MVEALEAEILLNILSSMILSRLLMGSSVILACLSVGSFGLEGVPDLGSLSVRLSMRFWRVLKRGRIFSLIA